MEMAIYAADPQSKPTLRAAANREIAQYLHPKRKSVEHSGDTAGLQVVLVNFTPGAAIAPARRESETIVLVG